MTVYLDENMPKHLAEGFNIIQNPENLKHGRQAITVKFLPDVYGFGTDDIDWIPLVGKEGAFVITQDIHITKRKDEIEAYQKCGVGLFLLKGTSKKSTLSVWEMTQALAKNWEAMVKVMLTEKPPFAYQIQLNRTMKRWK
ncbi:hypothetical protein [Xanthomarina gelatinilytica]|uniref:PIN-like domain-containing protein n=1 Tax=Xanthomarina gelatinilytica TaxID=1137281 RepID=UPI003AA976E9